MKLDLTGQRFGRYLVIEDSGMRSKKRKVMWRCKCDCGTERLIPSTTLTDGRSRSCGCYRGLYVMQTKGFMPGESLRTRVYQSYQMHSRKAGRDCSLSFEEFIKISSMSCHYCGAPPGNKEMGKRRKGRPGNGDFVYQGLDRIDNNQGYTIGNIVPCCITCNRAKKTMSYEKFLEWISRLTEHYHNHLIQREGIL